MRWDNAISSLPLGKKPVGQFTIQVSLFLVCAFLLLLSPATAIAQDEQPSSPGDYSVHLPSIFMGDSTEGAVQRHSPAFVPGEVLVGIKRDAVGAAALTADISAQAIESIDMRGLDGVDGDANVSGYLLRTESGSEWQTIESLRDQPGVSFAEPNWVVYAADTQESLLSSEVPLRVNDPLYRNEQWYQQRIMASRAWALSGQVSGQTAILPPIRVAIIDSGIDVSHADLDDSLSLQFRNYIEPGKVPVDDCGHGTHIAGLIGATINNRTGIAGVASHVSIVDYKVLRLEDKGNNTYVCAGRVSDIAQAIRDAADAGARVINLSLELSTDAQMLEAAVNYAHSKGAVLVGAAGNCVGFSCPSNVQYPAAYESVMAIGASDYFNNRVYYSNTGPELALVAPGGDSGRPILSTWSSDSGYPCPGELIESGGSTYCEDIGTSMSAGVVSGVAALVWSMRPELTVSAVESILLDTARPLPASPEQVGRGLVDANKALRYALRSRLNVAPTRLQFTLPTESAAFERTLTIENDSLEPVTWLLTGTQGVDWIDVVQPVSGTVTYGEPIRVPLVISTTHTLTGTYRDTFSVAGMRLDGSKIVVPVTVDLSVISPTVADAYLPVLSQRSQAHEWPYVDYHWEIPDLTLTDTVGRVERTLSRPSSIGITMPLTVTIDGRAITDLRIYADGRVSLPASASVAGNSDDCLPVTGATQMVVNGWWTDLDPGRGGTVSTFQAGPDRYVIEFLDMQVAGSAYNERASFQIVLYDNGDVGLNYARLPDEVGVQPQATVGVQSQNGRFFNQIGCVWSEHEYGRLPHSRQSLHLRQGDLF